MFEELVRSEHREMGNFGGRRGGEGSDRGGGSKKRGQRAESGGNGEGREMAKEEGQT